MTEEKKVNCIGCIDCGEYVMTLVTGKVHNVRCPSCSIKWTKKEGNNLVDKPMGDLE